MNDGVQPITSIRYFCILWAGLIGIALLLWPSTALAHHPSEPVNPASLRALEGLLDDEELCGPGGFRIEGTDLCTHGVDPIPSDEVLAHAERNLNDTSLPVTTVCVGDGKSGKRVQVMYVRAANAADSYATWLDRFRQIANNVGFLYDASAYITGGNRLINYVVTPDCRIDVLKVQIPAGADASLGATVKALSELGYNSPDRKYLIFMESTVYCGIATVVNDSQPGPANRSNHRPGYARVDRGCWEVVTAAHELTHTLGGIQHTAPNATGGWHCTDQYDVMCYSDSPYYPAVFTVCNDTQFGSLLDCNNDDYFHTNPAPGSYLAEHWNVADSQFLIHFDNIAPDADAILRVKPQEGAANQLEQLLWMEFIGGEEIARSFKSVEYYLGDQLLGVVSEGNFELAWSPPQPGDYMVVAKLNSVFDARVLQELRVKVVEPKQTLYLPMIRFD